MLRILAIATASATLLAPGCAALADDSPPTVTPVHQGTTAAAATATIALQDNTAVRD